MHSMTQNYCLVYPTIGIQIVLSIAMEATGGYQELIQHLNFYKPALLLTMFMGCHRKITCRSRKPQWL